MADATARERERAEIRELGGNTPTEGRDSETRRVTSLCQGQQEVTRPTAGKCLGGRRRCVLLFGFVWFCCGGFSPVREAWLKEDNEREEGTPGSHQTHARDQRGGLCLVGQVPPRGGCSAVRA